MSLTTRSSSRLSAYDSSTSSYRRSQSSTPSAAATETPSSPSNHSSPRSPSRSTPPKKRSRSEQKTSKQRTRKRKNCTDIEERRRQLEADPWTLEVRSRIVRCLGCKRWIKLDQRNEYYSGLWAKHRDLCRGVKMMKGEVLPKRTRRSKKKTAASVAKDSTSATSPAAGTNPVTTPETPPVHREILSTHSGSHSLSELSPEITSRSRAHSETATTTDRTSASSNPYPPPPPSVAPMPSSAYHWPQYVPYSYGTPYHFAYYPVAHHVKLPPISAMTRNHSPAPSEHDIEDEDSMDVDTGVDDVDCFAFAPASQNDCHVRGHGCHPRFRYSTRHEIQTYFDGATLDSMAQRLSCPADDMTYRGAVCLLSLRRK